MNERRDDGTEREEQDRLIFEGKVIEASNGKFRVQVNENHIALCTLSGKIRINAVKIIVSDLVRIEVSPYDVTRGRIIYRHKS